MKSIKPSHFLTSLLIAVATVISFSPKAFATNGCSEALSDLNRLISHRFYDSVSSQYIQDGLFTVAVWQSPLLTSDPFINLIDEAVGTIKEEIPDKDWGKADIKRLRSERWGHRGLGIVLTGITDYRKTVAADTAMIKDLQKQRKEKMAKRDQLIAEGDPKIEKLPTRIKIQIADYAWKELYDFYTLPTARGQLTLEQTVEIKKKAIAAGLTFPQFLDLSEITRQIEAVPEVRVRFIEFIAKLMELGQGNKGIFKSREKLRTSLSRGDSIEYKYASPVISIDHINYTPGFDQGLHYQKRDFNGRVVRSYNWSSFKDVITGQWEVLFNDRYFNIFLSSLQEQNFSPENFLENYQVYSPQMRQELSELVWNNLKSYYRVDTITKEKLTPADIQWVTYLAKENDTDADSILQTAFAIQAVEANEQVKSATLKMIEENFKASAEIIPHLLNAEKWKDRKTKGTTLGRVAKVAIGGAAYVGDLYFQNHLPGGGHVLAHASGIGLQMAAQLGSDKLVDIVGQRIAGVRERRAREKLARSFKERQTENEWDHTAE